MTETAVQPTTTDPPLTAAGHAADEIIPSTDIPGFGRAVLLMVLACVSGTTAAVTAVVVAVRQGGPIAWIICLFELGALVLGAMAVRHRRRTTTQRVSELDAARQRFAADVRRLEMEQSELRSARADLLEEERAVRDRIHHTFVNLSMRTLTLVERQLDLIERLEHGEDDPDRLDDLFQLDHLATRMRRNSENLLVIADADEHHGNRAPSTVLDVVRAAVSEIERYERVDIGHLPGARFAGHTSDDISHLLAELLENAAAYSAPESRVRVAGRQLDNGEIVLSIDDEGIGVPEGDLATLNARLHGGEPEADELSGLGVFVVGALARRHGIRVQLRSRRTGGLSAVVLLPSELVHGPGPTPAEISHERARERERVVGEPVRVRPDREPGAEGAAPAAAGPNPASTAPAAPARESGPTPDPASLVAGTTAAGLPARARGRAAGTAAPEDAAAARTTGTTGTTGTASTTSTTGTTDPADGPPAPSAVGRTAKGLPKRIASPAPAPAPGTAATGGTGTGPGTGTGTGINSGPDTGSISAEELRRRLTGFASGLAAGRKEAAEVAAAPASRTGSTPAGATAGAPARPDDITAPASSTSPAATAEPEDPAEPAQAAEPAATLTDGGPATPRDAAGRDDHDSDGDTPDGAGTTAAADGTASGRAGAAAPGGGDR